MKPATLFACLFLLAPTARADFDLNDLEEEGAADTSACVNRCISGSAECLEPDPATGKRPSRASVRSCCVRQCTVYEPAANK